MTRRETAVNKAMRERRPPKDIIRDYWADEYEYRLGQRAPGDDSPMYLTLPGEEGLDIKILQTRGLVRSTEVGGIDELDLGSVIAIERSPLSVSRLQEAVPGLRILKVDVAEFIRGRRQTRFPIGEHHSIARARIINLDLNTPLAFDAAQGTLDIPLIGTIAKFCRLHADHPVVREWTLLLTLHASISGPPEAFVDVHRSLAANCREVAEFHDQIKTLLGEVAFELVVNEGRVEEVVEGQSQQVLMAFVPKRIVEVAKNEGWSVQIHRNMAYPGGTGSPGMVSWIIRFQWDPRARSVPLDVYREGIASVLSSVEYPGA